MTTRDLVESMFPGLRVTEPSDRRIEVESSMFEELVISAQQLIEISAHAGTTDVRVHFEDQSMHYESCTVYDYRLVIRLGARA